VMLLNLNREGESLEKWPQKLGAVVAGCILMIVLTGILRTYDIHVAKDPSLTQIGLVKNLGIILFKEYLLPFEISSILFLTAMVGALLLGKKEQI
jgi:NADH-quinone oxidoreductase subunit J